MSSVSPVSSVSLAAILSNTALLGAATAALSSGSNVGLTNDTQAATLAQGLLGRASDLSGVGNAIGQGIGVLQAAGNGLTAIGSVIGQLKGVVQQAQSTTNAATLSSLQGQYNTLRGQIDSIASDSSYGGVSLISSNPSSLTVTGPTAGQSDTIAGSAADSASLGITAAANWGGAGSTLQADAVNVATAGQTARSQAAGFGADAALLQTQAFFLQAQGNIATQGAASLTAVDPYATAASALAASTYVQLGYATLGLAAQSQQSVLRLFASPSKSVIA
jgi:flagellin-like hook-associated protein FlgL